MDAKYLFATVQTLSKEQIHTQFDPAAFDYIVFDEAHRSAADTYQRIFHYFKPQFMLGMTATPERTDDLNIFEQFNYNVAYEIRLQKPWKVKSSARFITLAFPTMSKMAW